jgi:ASCH domain
MHALSIRQPYASAILRGLKRTEYRSWPTTFRGPLVVHASLTRSSLSDLPDYPELRAEDLRFGALLGIVDVVDCVQADGPDGPEYHWHLRDPRPFREPVPFKGRLGLWSVGPGVFAGQLAAK